MVIFTVANIKIESLDFKAKNVSDADRAYILIQLLRTSDSPLNTVVCLRVED